MTRSAAPSRPTVGRLRTARSARRRRGVGYIWFCLVGLPFIFFAGGMGVDVSRSIVVHREVYLAAESAALAGSWQISVGGQLDANQAAQVANDTFSQEEHPSADPAGSSISGATITGTSTTVSGDTVTYTVRYQLNQLVFADLFGAFSSHTYKVSASAFVCSALNSSGPTQGNCVRPIA